MKRILLAGLVGVLAPSSSNAGDVWQEKDTHKLAWDFKEGQRFHQKAAISGKVMQAVGESAESRLRLEPVANMTDEWEFTDQVLKVSGGLPVSVERHFLKWSSENSGEGEEKKRTVNPLEGNTLHISMVDGKVKRRGPEGLSPEALKKASLEHSPLVGELPTAHVPVGYRWALKRSDILNKYKSLTSDERRELKDLKGTGRFVKVVDHRGRRCALIKNVVTASGPLKGKVRWEWKTEYEVSTYLSLEDGIPLDTTASNKMQIMGPGTNNGKKVYIGSQTVIMAALHTILK